MRKNASLTQEMPSKIRFEQARILRANAKFGSRLSHVRSSIPMNSAVRKDQGALMDSYRRFASKYNGQKPRLDPLL